MSKILYRTLREKVVSEIRMKILNRELEPGVRIVEQELSNELGVSRGPIREALRQLEQEGIVEYTRNVGCSVKQVTIQDLYEIYLLRSSYETLAVRLCDARFQEKELEKMEEVLERMKNPDMSYMDTVSHDHMFHRIIVEKANSERLGKVWSDLDYGSIVSSYIGNFDKGKTAKRQYAIHRELADACKTRDADVVCNAISRHYMSSVSRFMEEESISEKELRLWGIFDRKI